MAADGALIRHRIEVRWRDLDAFNHVNNANFLTYIEEARVSWLRRLATDWDRAAIAPLLAAVQINYRRPIEWPATVSVSLNTDRIGSTSLTLGHRIVDADHPDRLYADGHSVLVWIDRAAARPIPLPEDIRRACAAATEPTDPGEPKRPRRRG
ncbi:MAG TPA: acyl-CoA thioesterase [Xanthomonadales bacterium]|nr:acyl-CoA thioesterase [Xanthomonadales bacterium]